MEFSFKTTVTVDVAFINVRMGIRYWDEDVTLNGVRVGEGAFPGREDDNWKATIHLQTGKVLHWPLGATAEFDAKVCDDTDYRLMTEDGTVVYSRHDIYVPRMLGGGDYVRLSIDENGNIKDWKPNLDDLIDGEGEC